MMAVRRFNYAWFNMIHTNHLVYNTCWEDPRVDRLALAAGPDDSLLTITSAGCNVLDYALLAPRHIYAVDVNYRQNALLELKLAGIRHLEFEPFFAMFGRGSLPQYRSVYRQRLRPALSPTARAFWDRHIGYFAGCGWQPTFYFHGTSGVFARLVNTYLERVAKVREWIAALLDASSLDEQRTIYDRYLRGVLWTRFIRWFVGQDMTLSLLGIPPQQRQQIERNYRGGIVQFMEDCVEAVLTHVPCRDNYFWRVYFHGAYTPECCPEYLKRENFTRLKAGLADRISVHTMSLRHFLATRHVTVSRVILLDHMDWLSTADYSMLQQEWQALVDRAAPGTRLLWRSGGLRVDYVDPIEVMRRGRRRRVGELLTYHRDLAATLHTQDRVHTYGSFYIADLAVA